MRHNFFLPLLLSPLILLPLVACATGPDLAQQPSDAPATTWTDLSNPASWRGYKKKYLPDGWVFTDGVLHLTGEGEGGDIVCTEMYESFELRLQWKISPKGNSGVMFHVLEGNGPTYYTGPEMQVLDNAWFEPEKPNPLTSAGANYALHGPRKDNTLPVGQWNQNLLIVNGNHVEHWMNDVLQCSYDLHSPSWNDAVAKSKFNQWPGYGQANKGYIALQDHGDQVWYRSIEVRKLEAR